MQLARLEAPAKGCREPPGQGVPCLAPMVPLRGQLLTLLGCSPVQFVTKALVEQGTAGRVQGNPL